MPVSDLHGQVAAVALGAAAGHGFALGGGNALLAHGVITRPTLDVDLCWGRYSPAQLIGFARRLDPGLTGRDFADAGRRLDQMPDQAFAAIGLSSRDVATVRKRFAAWPRTAEAADPEPRPARPGERTTGRVGAERDADAGWEAEPGR